MRAVADAAPTMPRGRTPRLPRCYARRRRHREALSRRTRPLLTRHARANATTMSRDSSAIAPWRAAFCRAVSQQQKASMFLPASVMITAEACCFRVVRQIFRRPQLRRHALRATLFWRATLPARTSACSMTSPPHAPLVSAGTRAAESRSMPFSDIKKASAVYECPARPAPLAHPCAFALLFPQRARVA